MTLSSPDPMRRRLHGVVPCLKLPTKREHAIPRQEFAGQFCHAPSRGGFANVPAGVLGKHQFCGSECVQRVIVEIFFCIESMVSQPIPQVVACEPADDK